MSTALLPDTREPLEPELDRVFREHHALVYRTAYSITGSTEDADDVVQTVFLRLLRRERPPDLNKNLKGYLYRAAFNAAVSVIRGRRRSLFESVDVADVSSRQEITGVADDLRRELDAAVAELPPRAAQILILRYVHDCSLAEIAQTLRTTRSAVAVSLFRSRARLKKKIREVRKTP